jgi:single-stranded-DNA-specific exonuclease
MERATGRIREAVTRGETIGIFGDYDCDGITAVAQLVRFFRRQNIEPWVRLPHRVRDGYGLTEDIVQECIDAKISVLITADTGIGAVQEIAKLSDAGIDVIVTDHHHVHEEVPPAYAIVHPALSSHPLPHPSGSGVAFKLVYALEEESWDGMEEDLSLAMFGTVADLVELRGENKALTILGLQALEKISNSPIATLRERCRSSESPLTSTDIAFRIAPRINAAGRISEPDIALRALLDGGESIAELDALNEHRQELSRELYTQAIDAIEDTESAPLLASVSGQYPHGIVGLIAGKLTEKYGKPSLIANTDGRTCTASLRSPALYNVTEGLGRCSDLLISFGGHAQAAGCTFAIENFDAIKQKLSEDIATHVDTSLLVPTLKIDAVMDAKHVTIDFAEKLKMLEPYGQGNPEPLFLFPNVSLTDARACGADNTHLQARIFGVKCIGFGMAHLAEESEKFDVVARIGIDGWNGRRVPQLILQDLGVALCDREMLKC